MGPLAGLLFYHALGQDHLRGALALEGRIVARIALELAVVDMHDDVDHAVEEVAIMRDHHQRAGIALQPVFQPDDCVQVQMVGRLVQQQQVGRAHQRLRQVQAHAPAAGKAGDRLAHLLLAEAQAGQQLLAARTHGVGVGVGQRAMQVGDAVAVVCTFGLAFKLRELGFQPAQTGVAVDRIIERGAVQRRGFLRDIGDPPGGREAGVAQVGMQLAAQDAKQAGLAGAIGTDQADFFAGVEGEVDVLE